jgi:S-formylglutathione hydrolase FrmB
MGGGGSVRLGLKHPERFASIWAHSSSLPNAERLMTGGATAEAAAAGDVCGVADRLVGRLPRPSLPRLSFDCGTEDGLRGQNVAFHAHLDAIGYPHQYREHPGAHTWEYWDLHVREALVQHAVMLGIRRR